ncbi:hypothetical protein HY625_02950 [Candidatus Uhrbacteria bacterium]|nr:hypothetical protein [Candidatus Uhrbacteria bacterium]
MSLRTKLFIIIGVVVAFIAFVVVMLMGNAVPKEPVVETPLNSIALPQTPSGTSAQPSSVPAPLPQVPAPAPEVTTLVRAFAERFGSFSNQSDFENVRELSSFMSPVMQLWADRFIAESRAKLVKGAPYYGVTTRVVQMQVRAMDERAGTGEVLVKTQRREVKGNETPRSFSQDLLVRVKKIDGEWKVEGVEWK